MFIALTRSLSLSSAFRLIRFFFPPPVSLPFSCQTGQILETCIIWPSQDAGGKVDLQRPIESTYPSSPSNPQPAAPADRGAQWPICAEVPRNKNIYLREEGRGKGGEWASREGKREQECRPHTSTLWTARLPAEGYRMSSLAFPIPAGRQAGRQEPPSLFANLYLLALYVHLSARQTKHVILGPHQLDTHTHRHSHPSTGGKGPQTKLN